MSRFHKIALALILVVAGVITSVSGVLQSPRTPPDERHHYSYIKYVSEHFGQFPVDLASIYTDREGDPNHLMHPPLYYYMMATCYRIIRPTKDFTSVGRELDRYGMYSSGVVIPILRAVSQLLVLGGLLGVFLLVNFLVSNCRLNPWLALIGAALTTLVPAFTYIGGALNNDALVLGLWPFVVLSALEFYFYEKARYFWKAMLFSSLAVLTKATMWVLVVGAILLVVTRLIPVLKTQGVSFFKPWKETIYRQRNDVWPEQTWLFLGLLSACLVIGVLGGNYLRYGSVQPRYSEVFNIALEESKSYKAEGRLDEIRAATYWDVVSIAAERVMKSTAGIVGHKERVYPYNPKRLVNVFAASVILLLVCGAGYVTNSRVRLREKFVAILFVLIPILVWLVFVQRSYNNYKTIGYFGAHGRYFVGYLHILVFGLFIMAGNAMYRLRVLRYVHRAMLYLAILGLALVLLRPFAYVHASSEVYKRAEIAMRVNETLVADGFKKLEMEWANPAKALRSPTSKGYLKPHYILGWHNTTIAGKIDIVPEASVLRIKIWAKGSTELGEQSQLRVGLGSLSKMDPVTIVLDESFSDTQLREDIDVYDATLRVPVRGSEKMLYVRFLNHRVKTKTGLERLWTMTRVPKLFGVFYKFEPGE
ncbi:MAG: glycosyltransferase family 39 protein [Deltaproteobacteria bacterium]|nr:glycosyltransferase family 39 protein [Deltaproteobacteria bacterium]